MDNILEVKDLCKTYKNFKLNNINFKVKKGCIMGVIGANGAGKSTTLKCILNLIKRESGSIEIFGLDNNKYDEEIKENLGIVLDECCFHDFLKATKISKIMNGIYKEWNEEEFFDYLEKFKIPKNKAIKEFSRGMKMKLSIAVALSHNAKLLILDEPTSGLDPMVRSEILDIFLDYIQDEERSVIISSHITSDLEKVADYITLIDRGNVIFSETKDDLINKYKILKGTKSQLDKIDKEDCISIRKNQFGFEALVADGSKAMKKYSNLLLENANIEEIMMFFVKGI